MKGEVPHRACGTIEAQALLHLPLHGGGREGAVSQSATRRAFHMTYRAIYTYAWDLAEAGVPAASNEFRDLGLDTVTIAGSYHAGKFLRPHGINGKVAMLEDGTVYFNADPIALRRHQADRQLDPRRDRHPAPADGAQGHRHQCLAGAAAQFAARRGASGLGGPQRLRRPVFLQPLPVRSGSAGLCGRPRDRRDHALRRCRACRSKPPASPHTRTAITTNSRCCSRTSGSRTCSGSASASTASLGPRKPASTPSG